eukprot:2951386-Prymnesium_polylepis.1
MKCHHNAITNANMRVGVVFAGNELAIKAAHAAPEAPSNDIRICIGVSCCFGDGSHLSGWRAANAQRASLG